MKKQKSVLSKIGDVVSTGAEAVVDAGAKAIHAVGDMLPGTASPKKKAARPKATKTAAKSVKAAPKKATSKVASIAASAKKAPPAKKLATAKAATSPAKKSRTAPRKSSSS